MESTHFPPDILDRYAHGQCFFLALALHKHLGWPCVVFFGNDEDQDPLHVGNLCGAQYVDVYGKVSLEDLEDRYGLPLYAVVDPDSSLTLEQFEVSISDQLGFEDEYDENILIERAWETCRSAFESNSISVVKSSSPTL